MTDYEQYIDKRTDYRQYAITNIDQMRTDCEYVHKLIMSGRLDQQDYQCATTAIGILYKGIRCRATVQQLNYAGDIVDSLQKTYKEVY